MGVSIFNTPERDQLLQYTKSLQTAGLSATNATESVKITTGPIVATHLELSNYVCYSAAGSVTIRIPQGQVNSLIILDADRTWHLQPITIEWLDAGGSVLHSEVVNDRNGAYTLFEVGGTWYMNNTGRGRTDVIF